jgi:hypothetical protein
VGPLCQRPRLIQKVVALYTKEPRPTDKNTLPVEQENIPEEFKVRPNADRAEQLSLLSAEELAELQRLFASLPPQGDEILPHETARAQRPRRTKGSAIQDKLPGF